MATKHRIKETKECCFIVPLNLGLFEKGVGVDYQKNSSVGWDLIYKPAWSTVSSRHLLKSGNETGKHTRVSADHTLERQKRSVLELEILPGRQLLTLVKRVHSCETIKHFEKLPAVPLWSQIIFFSYWFLVQTSGETNLKEGQCFKGGIVFPACLVQAVWRQKEHQEVWSCFPFLQNHFQYENHMWPQTQTYLWVCLSHMALCE